MHLVAISLQVKESRSSRRNERRTAQGSGKGKSEQKTELINQIADYREELVGLGQCRLTLGRQTQSLLVELIAALEEDLTNLSEYLSPAVTSSVHTVLQ